MSWYPTTPVQLVTCPPRDFSWEVVRSCVPSTLRLHICHAGGQVKATLEDWGHVTAKPMRL